LGSAQPKLPEENMHKILRLPEVMKNTGLARSTIYKMIAAKSFPVQISLGVKSVGWLESDIQNWIQDKISQSKPEPNTTNQ
jgi:prophage regulatory protein